VGLRVRLSDLTKTGARRILNFGFDDPVGFVNLNFGFDDPDGPVSDGSDSDGSDSDDSLSDDDFDFDDDLAPWAEAPCRS